MAKTVKPKTMPATVAMSSRQPKILPPPAPRSGPPMKATPPMKRK